VLLRLSPPAFVSRDDEEYGGGRAQAGEHVADEALMSRHVDEGHLFAGVERRPGVAEVDGQPAPTLLGPAVGLGAGEGANEGGLPVVDVTGGGDHVHVSGCPRAAQRT
jgi:hypothetical protein